MAYTIESIMQRRRLFLIKSESKLFKSLQECCRRRVGKKWVFAMTDIAAIGQSNRPNPDLFPRNFAAEYQNVLVESAGDPFLKIAEQSPIEQNGPVGRAGQHLKAAFLCDDSEIELAFFDLLVEDAVSAIPAERLDEQRRELMVPEAVLDARHGQ